MIDENLDALEEMHQKLRNNFAGKIVRKDLTKKIKEGEVTAPFIPSVVC